ncbi:MAG: ribonuclease P protein component 4 [Methanomassiliicoccaceae archaeon]|nr:ribonuclease P protein component 4 [Methanomassiliicoccaceae archaeon]
MSKRVSRSEITNIANTRITKLMSMSEEQAAHGDADLARRYVDLARRISMRTKTKIPKWHIYCKACLTPMAPGTFTVRLRDHKVIMRCTECGCIKRVPYLKEQKG